MRGGRRLDDAATSHAMLGRRATRARDTARFTALEDMIRELAPFPPSYDVSAGQDTGFAEWRYTDLLGGIYLSTQSTEINCRIMALAAVSLDDRRVDARIGHAAAKEPEEDVEARVQDKGPKGGGRWPIKASWTSALHEARLANET